MKRLSVFALLLSSALAQTSKEKEAETLVTVPQRYVSSEGLQHQAYTPTAQASQWIGFGKEVGQAMNETLPISPK